VNALQKFHIGYYEEPLAKQNFSDYKNLRIKTQCKILLDESLCTTQDAMHAVQHQACDALNIRLAKCGGFIQSIEILKISLANKISYQIGVQVAETGPLLAASRIMASITNDYFAYEAGQPDRQFEQYIISPMPIVDRSTNYATPIHGSGLGVYLNEKFKQYIKQEIICQGKKTYEKT
jgi:L-alanine-DL-glutamate epimerase-like enolase superfamily enzyme